MKEGRCCKRAGLPDFRTYVKHCGTANAFSTPNITLCVELLEELEANGHSDWLYKDAKDLEGEYVQVTGWLITALLE